MAFVSAVLPLGVSAQMQSVQHAQPVKYLENKNQWESNILFKTQIGFSSIYLEKNTITFDLVHADDMAHIHHPNIDTQHVNNNIRHHAYKMVFKNANPEPQIIRNLQSPEYYNYLLTNDPKNWASFVYGYSEVTYKKLYNGIDLKWYSSGENIKYDFIVAPGADADDIKINYVGTDGIFIENGNLQIKNSVNPITETKPYAYQYRNGKIVVINCEYVCRRQHGIIYFSRWLQ
jgi:hypothetical protein